ncbi:Butirosin biosynthesis, BtrG-like protein [Syncephalastrum racemosum]|uniref:Putative gamma-glutamylcyclotransferase n=1 Tax=Syncephalastrum racemosum TaxID=13706 RepID=A0A1X2HCP6_SYNRA|nr:Butirosin biosynthesis, BtrG-like protein [Syncephalastrum racemosum]
MSSAAFFYGTLMSPDVHTRVICGLSSSETAKQRKLETLVFRPAILKGHRRYALKGLDYPGVIRTDKEEDQVLGVVCEGLLPGDVKRLDAFEGDEYERRPATVHIADNEDIQVDCQVYIWTAGNHHLEAHDWELEGFIKSKQALWLNDRCEFYMVDKLDTSA